MGDVLVGFRYSNIYFRNIPLKKIAVPTVWRCSLKLGARLSTYKAQQPGICYFQRCNTDIIRSLFQSEYLIVFTLTVLPNPVITRKTFFTFQQVLCTTSAEFARLGSLCALLPVNVKGYLLTVTLKNNGHFFSPWDATCVHPSLAHGYHVQSCCNVFVFISKWWFHSVYRVKC